MAKKVRGFTLIELIVVVIIVGILGSVSIPIMNGMIIKAKKTEAVTAMGAIRTAERLYYAQHDEYVIISTGTNAMKPAQFAALGLDHRDFDGTYFSNSCYRTDYSISPPLHIYCDAIFSTNPPSPRAGEVTGLGRFAVNMNGESGEIDNY